MNNKNHIKSLITVTLLCLNLLAVVISLITSSWMLLTLNALGAGIMCGVLYQDWKQCQQSRKNQFLAG